MILKKIYPIIVLSLTTICLSGQNSQDSIRPEPAILEYVTVNPANGVVNMRWTPGPSDDVTHYMIYNYVDGNAFPIDTINDPHAVSYDDNASLARYKCISYVVAAIDAAENKSPLSNPLSTIYLTAQVDTCNTRINLTWNACNNKRHPVTEYIIGYSVDGSGVTPLDTVDAGITGYTLESYHPGSEYCFYITASGQEGIVSVSNRQCVKTGLQRPPQWTRVAAMKVRPSGIEITGRYDTEGEINTFISQKKDLQTGIWQQVDSGNGSGGMVNMADTGADTTVVSLYRIAAINNCLNITVISEPVRNILLKGTREGKNIILRWNNPFTSEKASFSVYRNAGSGFEKIASSLSDTVFSDDYSIFTQYVTSGIITYRIGAVREESLSEDEESLSSAAVIETPENIMAANAFTPDGDGRNDLFSPALSFTPVSYDFKVMNRLGIVLFRTTNAGEKWDGYSGSHIMPAGTYLWTLVVKTPSGKTEKRSGTVDILP